MIYSNDTYDITNDISTYLRRDFNSVFDTSRNKWFMLNNLGNYEEYGIYGTDFSSYYVGKLVEVNGHEYEWDGTEWDDLGESVNPYIQFPNTYNETPSFITNTYLKNTYTLEFKMQTPSSNGGRWRITIGSKQDELHRFELYTNANNQYMCINWWNYGQNRLYNDFAFALVPNTTYVYEILIGTGVTKINGVTQSASGGNNVSGTLTEPLAIGGALEAGTPVFNGKIYYAKITEGDTLVAYYQADNTDNIPGFKDLVSGTKILKQGTGTVTYGADGGGKPKEYPTKTAPTITNYWNSRVFRNGSLIVKALQSDELVNLKYKGKNVLIKSEHEEDPYNTKAYLSLTGINSSFSNWPRFVTDLHLKNTYTIEVKCKPISMYNEWKLLWGSYDDNNMDHNGFAWLKSGNGSTRYSLAFWNYNVGRRVLDLNFTNMDNNTIYTIITEVGTGNTTINGGSIISGNGNNISGTLTSFFQIGCVQTLYADGGFNGQIYYVKITEGNTLVAYYQADNTDNIPGFVDLVSGTKYTNSGSGTVTYGEDA